MLHAAIAVEYKSSRQLSALVDDGAPIMMDRTVEEIGAKRRLSDYRGTVSMNVQQYHHGTHSRELTHCQGFL